LHNFLNFWNVLIFCSNWICWCSFSTPAPSVVYTLVELEHLDRLADIIDRVFED